MVSQKIPASTNPAFAALAANSLREGCAAIATASMSAAAPRAGAAKRGLKRARTAPEAQVVLLEDKNGLLRWDYWPQAGVRAAGAGVARRRGLANRYRAVSAGANILGVADVPRVGPNQISAKLQQLDQKLTPERGLRPVVHGAMAAADPAIRLDGATRLLLLIHGTFSKGDMYMKEFQATPEGKALLASLGRRYSHICGFDHPTLSASTMVNGVNLEAALSKSGLPPGMPIDVVCHSRGGLVAAWWARHSRFTIEKIVSAGATYQGTTLASPYRIRQLLDHFATVAKIVSSGLGQAAAVPTLASGFLAGAGGLMGVLGHITKGLSALPLADAGIALVPGLQSMSYVNNNLELDALWQDGLAPMGNGPRELFVIAANYEPANDAPWWNLWQQLKSVPMQAANSLADSLFDDWNDLVVDTRNMRPKETIAVADSLVYAASDHVHHVNYFSQPRTVAHLAKWLKIP